MTKIVILTLLFVIAALAACGGSTSTPATNAAITHVGAISLGCNAHLGYETYGTELHDFGVPSGVLPAHVHTCRVSLASPAGCKAYVASRDYVGNGSGDSVGAVVSSASENDIDDQCVPQMDGT